MIKKYVFDGVVGGGKTTLLFGRCDEDDFNVNYSCLRDSDFNVFPDSSKIIIHKMKNEGKNYLENKQMFLKEIIKLEVHNFISMQKEGIYFFNGLCDYEMLVNHECNSLLENFIKYYPNLRYSNPIFLIEPLKSNAHLNGITFEERIKIHKKLKFVYEKYGYDVLEIPNYFNGKEENIKIRLRSILAVIGFNEL